MILFSDAVFAIAITLLAIDIKIPELSRNTVTDGQLWEKLREITPKFIGFLISFFLIGQYWIVHHRMFGFVINFSQRLVWLNILFLLAIVIMPFSTSFYSEYVGTAVIIPVIFYTGNIAMLGAVNFFMWQYISNSGRGLTENLSPLMAKYSSLRAVIVPIVFIIGAFVYVKSPAIAAFVPVSIPIVLRFALGPMKKRLLTEKKLIYEAN
jgi:uncharacterized membrane protein